jgi:hypothetical protein
LTKLTGDKVHEIFRDCLFREGEDTANHVRADGIIWTVGFHPDRLKSWEATIISLLDELPDKFKEGASFLEACDDKHGEQWTGMHQHMEQLFQLGLAINKVNCLAPREVWSLLPGGMPYYRCI